MKNSRSLKNSTEKSFWSHANKRFIDVIKDKQSRKEIGTFVKAVNGKKIRNTSGI